MTPAGERHDQSERSISCSRVRSAGVSDPGYNGCNTRSTMSCRNFPGSLGRHLAAGLGASPASFRALAHLLVLAHAFAILRAFRADFRARPAGMLVQRRAAQHEVRARVANTHAIEQQTDMIRGGVWPAFGQAMRNGLNLWLSCTSCICSPRSHHLRHHRQKSKRPELSSRSRQRSSEPKAGPRLSALYPKQRDW